MPCSCHVFTCPGWGWERRGCDPRDVAHPRGSSGSEGEISGASVPKGCICADPSWSRFLRMSSRKRARFYRMPRRVMSSRREGLGMRAVRMGRETRVEISWRRGGRLQLEGMADSGEEETSKIPEGFLNPDTFLLVMERLDARSIVSASAACRAWRNLLSDEDVWDQLIRSHFPNVDEETLARAYRNPPSHGKTGVVTSCVSRIAYIRLQKRHVCRHCGKIFRDGTNQRVSCRFHPGILFSGGHHNGVRITWLCCSRHGSKWGQSRADMYSNGCEGRYHFSESSLHAPDFCASAAISKGSSCSYVQHGRDAPVEWTPFAVCGYPSMPTGYL